MIAYDVYLVHANENAPSVKRLADALQARGLSVWFNAFIVGPSIRDQMEAGLRASEFGVVVLTTDFFAKKWSRQELDALFSLEGPGETRILPVWWGVGEREVREQSPMLVMRSASVVKDDNIEAVADALLHSILTLTADRSPAKRLRVQLTSGFQWTGQPLLMPQSLNEFDRTFVDDYGRTELVHSPALMTRPIGDVVMPIEVLRAHLFWDGKRVTLIGHQVPDTLQVFDQILRPEDLPPDPTRPPRAGIAAYVFQLSSVTFTQGELCYVYCIGPYDQDQPGMGPRPPDPNWQCWVTGLLMAFGRMANDRGRIVNAIYLAASTILFVPFEREGSSSLGG